MNMYVYSCYFPQNIKPLVICASSIATELIKN